jgi:hypothetical protein
MELIFFAVIVLFVAEAANRIGTDSRPNERDHARNW